MNSLDAAFYVGMMGAGLLAMLLGLLVLLKYRNDAPADTSKERLRAGLILLGIGAYGMLFSVYFVSTAHVSSDVRETLNTTVNVVLSSGMLLFCLVLAFEGITRRPLHGSNEMTPIALAGFVGCVFVLLIMYGISTPQDAHWFALGIVAAAALLGLHLLMRPPIGAYVLITMAFGFFALEHYTLGAEERRVSDSSTPEMEGDFRRQLRDIAPQMEEAIRRIEWASGLRFTDKEDVRWLRATERFAVVVDEVNDEFCERPGSDTNLLCLERAGAFALSPPPLGELKESTIRTSQVTSN